MMYAYGDVNKYRNSACKISSSLQLDFCHPRSPSRQPGAVPAAFQVAQLAYYVSQRMAGNGQKLENTGWAGLEDAVFDVLGAQQDI